jgi:DNA-binding transcriptional LysR family regulator
MTLKQLEVFLAIAESGSFSGGARKVCITQSTASQHIQALEEELGVRLFDRVSGGALLSEAGKLLRSRAHTILAECDESRAAIRRFIGMEDSVLRVGASTTPGTVMLPEIIGRFIKEYPTVRVEVVQKDSHSIVQRLLDERVELGFIGRRVGDERVHCELMGEDDVVCAASPELIPQGKRRMSQAELCTTPLILREEGAGSRRAVEEALAGTWIKRESLRIVAVLGSNEAIKQALLNRVGYAFVSRRSIAAELEAGRMTTVRIPGLTITRRFYAVRRKHRELSPSAAALWNLLFDQRPAPDVYDRNDPPR